MEDNLQIIKLNTGDTIVCQIIEETEYTIIIRLPYKVTTVGLATNKPKMALLRWENLIEVDEDIILNKHSIVATSVPIEELYNVYEELLVKNNMTVEEENKLNEDLETIEQLMLSQMKPKDITTH
tara:strand:+ start:25 stop:399 length:375 start_codon:yes stop_codon:yes gene_type:complete